MDEQSWSQLELVAAGTHEDMASWVLVQGGAIGCEVVPQSDEKVLIRASFEKSKLDKDSLQKLIALLEEYGLSDTLRSMKVSDIPREDWLAKWKEGFEPFRVGTQFVVCPVWRRDSMSPELYEGRKTILIDPGLAFWNGFAQHNPVLFACIGSISAERIDPGCWYRNRDSCNCLQTPKPRSYGHRR
jgi:Ribosomal protein L11 methylase